MANTTYVSPTIATQAARTKAYQQLASLMVHLEAFGINLVSVSVSAAPVIVTIVLNNPFPADNEAHFTLTKV